MMSDSNVSSLSWQGIHHIALSTPDLDETVHFYCDVLEMELLFEAPSGDMHGRHAAILPGGDYLGLHFFEYKDATIFGPSDIGKTMPWFPGALHHLAIAIPDEEAALKLRDRLETHGVQMSEIMDQGGVRNMMFLDNNGIRLEANWPRV
jgi:catechol 2,3-dioxygenase-like lactoylglutathione lyase family enzyme